METKTCSRCGEEKPLDAFSKRCGQCKTCRVEIERVRYAEKGDQIRARERERRRVDGDRLRARERERRATRRDEVNAQQRAWHAANRERSRELARAAYARNRDAIKERVRSYEQRNPEKVKLWARQQARRARGVTDLDYCEILEHDVCSYCGGPASGGVDHIDAVAAGGEGSFENLTAACLDCNRSKGQKTLLHFLLSRNAPAAVAGVDALA